MIEKLFLKDRFILWLSRSRRFNRCAAKQKNFAKATHPLQKGASGRIKKMNSFAKATHALQMRASDIKE
jgi:hypothetical protein